MIPELLIHLCSFRIIKNCGRDHINSDLGINQAGRGLRPPLSTGLPGYLPRCPQVFYSNMVKKVTTCQNPNKAYLAPLTDPKLL